VSSIPYTVGEAAGWQFHAGAAAISVQAEGLAAGPLPPCAVEAAIALDLAGELLDALAAAGLAHSEWQWYGPAARPLAGGAQARWQGREAQAWLSLPWAALRELPGPPEVPGLHWLPTPAECLLAQWRFSDEELAALEPGGLVVLDAPLQRLRARGESAPPAVAEAPWQLVARWEQPLALEVVMGWGGTAPALPAQCLLVEAARPEAARARGRLVPWGRGQALRVESV
jgi:hypothetical protein